MFYTLLLYLLFSHISNTPQQFYDYSYLLKNNIINTHPIKELGCLSKAIYFESRGEPIKGQYEVANVILNRVHSKYYPNTVCGVVNQKGQFSYNHNLTIHNKKVYNNIKYIAINSIYKWKKTDNPVLFYHNKKVKPRWSNLFVKTKVIGNHIFYRKRG